MVSKLLTGRGGQEGQSGSEWIHPSVLSWERGWLSSGVLRPPSRRRRSCSYLRGCPTRVKGLETAPHIPPGLRPRAAAARGLARPDLGLGSSQGRGAAARWSPRPGLRAALTQQHWWAGSEREEALGQSPQAEDSGLWGRGPDRACLRTRVLLVRCSLDAEEQLVLDLSAAEWSLGLMGAASAQLTASAQGLLTPLRRQ